MSNFSRLLVAIKAARQLGLTQVTLNALYKLGLKTGYFRLLESGKRKATQPSTFHFPFDLPSREQLLAILGPDGLHALLAEADQIVAGKYRQFGGQAVEINVQPPSQRHWTDCETSQHADDIKFTWEPARFGWAFSLGRAFHATGAEKYAAAFWRYFETFQADNPPYFGENWMSGQEVGLRLMAFAWAGQVFRQAEQTTPARLAALAAAIGTHAARIPATLLYARSQNNNHLLTEAAALYTAALALPEHPDSASWRKTGQKWLNWCFEHQIDVDGEYIQHSTNYHRLMLQVAAWIGAISDRQPDFLTATARTNLWKATFWLASLINREDGNVPNLGPNDGAYIFPLTNRPFRDFLPATLAVLAMFEQPKEIEGGEMQLWFQRQQKWKIAPDTKASNEFTTSYPAIPLPHGRAFLRMAHLNSRPGHADQLHLDLWWRSLNITLDPGTYQYNAAPPWDNALTATLVHNTVAVNRADQMPRVSRFLHLDWKAASVSAEIEKLRNPLNGEKLGEILWYVQRGYLSRFGIVHKRTIAFNEAEHTFQVRDLLQKAKALQGLQLYTLQWLLPDWSWKFERQGSQAMFRIASPDGEIRLKVHVIEHFTSGGEVVFPQQRPCEMDVTIVRAGERIFGSGEVSPVRGWFSPTYAVKLPALSFTFEIKSQKSVELVTEFVFPENTLPSERLN